jgi:uncharacterized protein (DUF362 family)
MSEDKRERLNRREFLKKAGFSTIGIAGSLAGFSGLFADEKDWFKWSSDRPDLVVVKGKSADKMLEEGLDAIGGLSRFISSGDVVFLKPNMSWNRAPKYCANTNPEMVTAAVKACFNAGADEVLVIDNTCDSAKMSYDSSGVADAAKDAGAKVSYFDDDECKTVTVKNGKKLKKAKIHRKILDADVFINLPVAKTHGITRLTLGMKNLMGCFGGNRGKWHADMKNYLADATQAISPNLTIIDATSILTKGGPQGGNTDNVVKKNTLIISEDIVAADAYATTLFDIEPTVIKHIVEGANRGLGVMDLDSLEIEKITA